MLAGRSGDVQPENWDIPATEVFMQSPFPSRTFAEFNDNASLATNTFHRFSCTCSTSLASCTMAQKGQQHQARASKARVLKVILPWPK